MKLASKSYKYILVLPMLLLLSLWMLNVPASLGGTAHESPYPCGANPEKIWDVNLAFVTKTGIRNDMKLRVPETYLLELSRTTSERKSVHLHATYDNLEPPCAKENGKYTSIVKDNLLSLHIKAKPKGNNNAIQYWIKNTRESWSKIEDADHPSFDHYIRPKGILPQSILIPKKDMIDNEAYYIECQGIIPNHKFTNSSCRVHFNYKDDADVGANFPITNINNIENVIQKSAQLINMFSANQGQGE